MASGEVAEFGPPDAEQQRALSAAWKRLGVAATIAAVIASPGLFFILQTANDWPWWVSLILTILGVGAVRGFIDIVCHRFIVRPSLYAATEQMKLEDVQFRRRRWFWQTAFKRIFWIAVLGLVFMLVMMFFVQSFMGVNVGLFNWMSAFRDSVPADQRGTYAVTMLFNFLTMFGFVFFSIFIFLGPLMIMGLLQMKGFEPGESDWGVKLDDIRGQKEPKAEVERVITLWAAGDDFRKAGGKPERGLLLIGAPGTGKTMLSKGIATSFNSPIMTMPGSGFAQTFIGVDVMVVMALIWRARRLARKWGGQCMIFIDEIDAVGRRRQGLGAGMGMTGQPALADPQLPYYGPWGAMNPSGDLIKENREWRDWVFNQRQQGPKARYMLPERLRSNVFPGMMGGGGSMALNQLLVQMDGMDSPPVFKKWRVKKLNTFLDALYIVPESIKGLRLRLKTPKPRPEQIYFIGATNVDINELDPALLRPGRMGRHIYFRTPDKADREDIFDLYLDKVAHDPEIDSPRRRDELARITGGYSPAMIEQVCSMALTTAHADGRPVFHWQDVIAAVTTIESGLALGTQYTEAESRAVAIHEAGHAITAHLYDQRAEATRLSIRHRGGSLGHLMTRDIEERHTKWRHEYVGDLVCTLGAMAAEHEFYGENGSGVGGDLQQATTMVAVMTGMSGMGAEPIDLDKVEFDTDEERDEAVERLQDRFARIGHMLMNRARSGDGDPIAAVLRSEAKRRQAAIILGQAYITARCAVRANRESIARIADTLIERQELLGDEVLELLAAAQLRAPAIDITDETIWPKL